MNSLDVAKSVDIFLFADICRAEIVDVEPIWYSLGKYDGLKKGGNRSPRMHDIPPWNPGTIFLQRSRYSVAGRGDNTIGCSILIITSMLRKKGRNRIITKTLVERHRIIERDSLWGRKCTHVDRRLVLLFYPSVAVFRTMGVRRR